MKRALWPLSYTGKMASADGFEPPSAGIKIPCLKPLGDAPMEIVAVFEFRRRRAIENL